MQIPLEQYGCMIAIHAFFFKFEYPCETRLPGSMGDPIVRASGSLLRVVSLLYCLALPYGSASLLYCPAYLRAPS